MRLEDHLRRFSQFESERETLLEQGCTELIRRGISRIGTNSSSSIGNYELLEQIGRGGMGEVWLARHTKLDRIVALKRLHPSILHRQELKVRFSREMKIAGKLKHPNIASISDAGEVGGVAFLIMEHIDGLSLDAWLIEQDKPTDTKLVVSMMIDVGKGLVEAHQQGIIHRDLKPSNLMLDKEGCVKILDFGLARLITPEKGTLKTELSLTETGRAMGTLDYMAPEQVRDSHSANEQSDIYSWGATIYKLLCGTTACMEGVDLTPQARIFAIASQTPKPIRHVRPDIPPELDELVATMLRKDGSKRPQAAQEVVRRLREIQSNHFPNTSTEITQRALASRAEPKDSFTPPGRISKWWLALAPILLVIFSIVILLNNRDGTSIRIECADDIPIEIERIVDGQSTEPIAVEVNQNTKVRIGMWQIKLPQPMEEKYTVSENKFEVFKGLEKVITIERLSKNSGLEKQVAKSDAPANSEIKVAAANSNPSLTSDSEFAGLVPPVINMTNYSPPSESQRAAYSNVLKQTGLIPREIIRPGLPLEGIQLAANGNTPSPGQTGLIPPPTISPSGRFFSWLTFRNGAKVKNLHTNKFVQYTPGDFRSARWSLLSSDGSSEENTRNEHLILTPIDLNLPIEIRLPNGQLIRQIKVTGERLEAASYFGSADVYPVPNSDHLFMWSQTGAVVFDLNGKIHASIESEIFSKMFQSDPRRCGDVCILETEDETKPWAFFFTSSDEVVRRWQPKLQFDQEEFSTSKLASLVELDLDKAVSDGEIEDWFIWQEEETSVIPGFITASPDSSKILLSSGWGQKSCTIILGQNKERLAKAEVSGRFAFNPSGFLLVDDKGQIYNEHLQTQNANPTFNSTDTEPFPDIGNYPKQPIWVTESKVHLATLAHEDGVFLFEGAPAKELALVSSAPSAANPKFETSNEGEIGVSLLFVPSSGGGGWRNRSYYATFDSFGTPKEITQFDRIGAHQFVFRSRSTKNWLFYGTPSYVELMPDNGSQPIATFKDESRGLWSTSGKQLLIGTAKHLTIYDSNGTEQQKVTRPPNAVINMNFEQDRWSSDGRFLVDCAEVPTKQFTVIPVIFDLETGRQFKLKSHSYFDPIRFSPDSKWLCIWRKHSKSPNITILNLETGERTESTINARTYHLALPPFVFSPNPNEAVTLDGLFKIQPNGSLKKQASIDLPENTRWDIQAFVNSNQRLGSEENQSTMKMLLLESNREDRKSYAWTTPGEVPDRRPLLSQHEGRPQSIFTSESGAFASAENCLSFLPMAAEQPTRFARIYPNQSILSSDEFGNIETRHLKSDINDYILRTFSYSGGRTVAVSESDYRARVSASPRKKLEFWLTDLGIEYKTVSGDVVELFARNLAELSGTDLGVVSQLKNLNSLAITDCPNVDFLPTPRNGYNSLTTLTVKNMNLPNSLPEFLTSCPNLKFLDISGSSYPQLFISNILACKNLKTLRASKSFLSESIAKAIATSLPDCKVEIVDEGF